MSDATAELKALNQVLATQVKDLTEKVECLVESNAELAQSDERHRHNILVLRVISVVMAAVLVCLGYLFWRADGNYDRSRSALSIAEQTQRSRVAACIESNERDEGTRRLLINILTQAYTPGNEPPNSQVQRELRGLLKLVNEAYVPRDCLATNESPGPPAQD